jgi:hypothetical protein
MRTIHQTTPNITGSQVAPPRAPDPALIRRDRFGVVLRYEIGAPLKLEAEEQPSDPLRIAIIEAEHELAVLKKIIFDHLDLSNIARIRVDDALHAIYRALQIKRRKAGMYVNGN